MTAESRRALMRFWLPVACALSVHAALGITAACKLTPTHDEYWHLPIGLLNLETGRFHFDNLNPPLCRVLAALPVAIAGGRIEATNQDRDALHWGDDFLSQNQTHYGTWFVMGRAVIVLISVVGGLTAAVWARQLFGNAAGCLAALLWAFEPNLIANGSLVTTDMGGAAFFVLTLFCLWRLGERPGWKWALAFGASLGLAQLAKFTSVLLYPLGFVLLLPLLWRPDASASQGNPNDRTMHRRLKLLAWWTAGVVVSGVILNAGYLCRGSFSSLDGYQLQSNALRSLSNRLGVLGRIPLPVPRDYLEGIDHQRRVMEQHHPVYLDGEWRVDGFPNYYLWALFYKLPHPLQILVIATLLFLVMPGRVPRRPFAQFFILVPAVAMVAVANGSTMQLGVRYVLPAIPFLILFASQSAQWIDFKSFPLRAATIVILACWMMLSVRYHPNHLAYFNELAGGPIEGREHLLDSNLDWGQDLDSLKKYLDERGIGKIGLAYFGTVPPHFVGIEYDIPPSRIPQPGRFAVSVNYELGRPYWVRTPSGDIRQLDIGEFDYFSFFKPVAHIGYSIDVFELSERDIAAWKSAVAEARGG